jgi:hypothetical protein
MCAPWRILWKSGNSKLGCLGGSLEVGNRNVEAAMKKSKNKLICEIDSLDKLFEQRLLNEDERAKRSWQGLS